MRNQILFLILAVGLSILFIPSSIAICCGAGCYPDAKICSTLGGYYTESETIGILGCSYNNQDYDYGAVEPALCQACRCDVPSGENCDWQATQASCSQCAIPPTGTNDVDGDGIIDICDPCPDVLSPNALSADSTKLCTGTEQVLCGINTACTMYTIDTIAYFCDSSIWRNKAECEDAGNCANDLYFGDGFVCDLINGEKIEPDSDNAICEYIAPGTQGECDTDGETGCYVPGAPDPQNNKWCCGDDGIGDTWVNGVAGVCNEGTYYTDPDKSQELCQLIYSAPICDTNTHGYKCWFEGSLYHPPACCGDDTVETWSYTASDYISSLLMQQSCYRETWYDRTKGKVTYYAVTR